MIAGRWRWRVKHATDAAARVRPAKSQPLSPASLTVRPSHPSRVVDRRAPLTPRRVHAWVCLVRVIVLLLRSRAVERRQFGVSACSFGGVPRRLHGQESPQLGVGRERPTRSRHAAIHKARRAKDGRGNGENPKSYGKVHPLLRSRRGAETGCQRPHAHIDKSICMGDGDVRLESGSARVHGC